MSPPARNPYMTGTVVKNADQFFGRQEILNRVVQELHNPGTVSLVLSGQRRIGKSSLLHAIERSLSPEEFLPVLMDLMTNANKPVGTVLGELAHKASRKAKIKPLPVEDFDNEGIYFQETFLPQLYAAIGDGCRPVFLLDEFDVADQGRLLDQGAQEASTSLFYVLYQLMDKETRPAYVFVIGRRPDDVSLDVNAVFKASVKLDVWLLDQDSAVRLVRQAEDNKTLSFAEGTVERILTLTNSHPYLTQLLCNEIWQRAYVDGPSETPLITPGAVDAAVPGALGSGDRALEWLWNGLRPAEKIYLSALAQIAEEGKSITKTQVIDLVTSFANRLRTREVEDAPRELVDRQVLRPVAKDEYAYAVEIFRIWVNDKKPLQSVKKEIDEVIPRATTLFNIGYDSYTRQEWDDAIRYFYDALKSNPRHFPSHYYLGETYYSKGMLDESIQWMEKAYSLDPDDSRMGLARTLLAKARFEIQKGDSNTALKLAERAVEVSPNERSADEMRVEIWNQRGESALKRNDLRTAAIAYRQAGNEDKLADVVQLERQGRIKLAIEQARDLIRREDWEQASEFIKNALEEFPKDESYDLAKLLNEVDFQKQIDNNYQKATQALNALRTEDAKALFHDVWNKSPDYKDTLRYLLLLYKGLDYIELQMQLEHTRNAQASADEMVKQLNRELSMIKDSLAYSLAKIFIPGQRESYKPRKEERKYNTSFSTKYSESQYQDEPDAPVAQYRSTYILGDDLYDDSFSIDSIHGDFLGECGIGISERIGVGEPTNIAAVEVWLFDKNDIMTVTKVLMSDYAFNDSSIRERVKNKGESVLIQPGKRVVLKTATLQLEAHIVDIQYRLGPLPPNAAFERLTVELAVWELK